jgi:Tol biopolymer transport system component
VTNSRSVLLLLAFFALVAVYSGSAAPPRLQYVTTAYQAGPVGYRDPVGAVSPDGVWLAYVSNRHLFLHRIEGTSTTELPPADNIKGTVIWFPDSRGFAVVEVPFGASPQWFRYDVATGKREPLVSPPAPGNQPAKPPSISEKTWGATAYSPDRRVLYYSVPNARGTLDLWLRNLDSGDARQLTQFDRDTYDPSVTSRGDVLFKTQIFSAVVGLAPADGGPTRVMTTFQSETPAWSPDGKSIGLTFGSWRRVTDDARYPDIAQDLGIISADDSTPASKPGRIFQSSNSEDQGMAWSPNGKWIVFHSHRDKADDLFLQLADASQPARQITTGGMETGWPHWSPDGRWIAYSSYPGSFRSTRSKLYVLGIDHNSGQVTQAAAPVDIDEQTESVGDPGWMPDSDRLIFESEGVAPGRKLLAEVSRKGGRPRKIIDFDSDQEFSGISTSPDGKWVAYVAQAPDGTYQIFRVPVVGGAPQQLTTDPNHKTQPSFSPNGARLAFTIWRYEVQFWMLRADD